MQGKQVMFNIGNGVLRPAMIVSVNEDDTVDLNVQYSAAKDAKYTGHGQSVATMYNVVGGEGEGQYRLPYPQPVKVALQTAEQEQVPEAEEPDQVENTDTQIDPTLPNNETGPEVNNEVMEKPKETVAGPTPPAFPKVKAPGSI